MHTLAEDIIAFVLALQTVGQHYSSIGSRYHSLHWVSIVLTCSALLPEIRLFDKTSLSSFKIGNFCYFVALIYFFRNRSKFVFLECFSHQPLLNFDLN